MAKGLPYFKFTPTEWLTGNICFESLESQGLFINICALYWQRDGVLSVEDINLRYNKPTALVSLTDRYFSVSDGFITIEFLTEQLHERKHISVVNSDNGKLGGRPKTKGEKPTANRPQSDRKAKKSQKEEEKEEELNNVHIFTFDEFWDLYPIKANKKDSMVKFNKLSDSDKQKIKETLPLFLKHKPFKEYTHPNPTTYLNQKRWDDELPVSTKASSFSGNKSVEEMTAEERSFYGL